MGRPRTIGSLFSGIGGLELGLEMAGLGPTVWQVEADPFCRRILERHWPEALRYEDVRSVGRGDLPHVDLVCGGFPCQDVSSAGARKGLAGERSGLWFEFARIVGELRPEWVVVENVGSGAKLWVDAVVAGLGQLGYEAFPFPVSAQDVGAPHIRRRIFVVAHVADADGEQLWEQSGRGRGAPREGTPLIGEPGANGNVGHPHRKGESAVDADVEVAGVQGVAGGPPAWASAPEFRGMDDGVPDRVDRLRALGNAVVPQCAEVVGWIVRELSDG